MWDKKVHVKSSMEAKDSQWSLFIGRWQPLHEGHKELFRQVISEGGKVCVAIRSGEVNEKNPFTAEQVKENIESSYASFFKEGVVRVMIIPDICSVEFGRGVGYDIIEHIPPTEVGNVSATKIREQMRKDGKL